MFKKSRVIKRRPDRWRIGESESWFSHMSAQGLHLNELNLEYAYFTKGEPEQYRYRFDYSDFASERREFYHENGWDLAAYDQDIGVYRSLKSVDAPELHTDPIETSHALRRLKNRSVRSAIGVVVAVSILFLLYSAFSRSVSGNRALISMLFLVQTHGFVLLAQFLALLNFVYLSVKYAVSIALLYISLREGREIDHNADWSPALKRKKRRTTLLLSAQLCVIAILLGSLVFSSSAILPDAKEDIVYKTYIIGAIRLADIESDGRLLRREVISSMSGKDIGNFIEFRQTPLTAFYIVVTENGAVPGRQWADGKHEEIGPVINAAYEPYLSYTLYKPRFRFVADALYRELVSQKETWSSKTNSSISEIYEYLEFERLIIQTFHDSQEKTDLPRIGILAMTPDYIIDLTYRGEEDLHTVLEAITDSLI